MISYNIGFQALGKEKHVISRVFNAARLKRFHEKKDHFKVKTRILILIQGGSNEIFSRRKF